MNDGWKSYPRAPAAGTLICAANAVPDPGTHSVDLDGFPILLVRTPGAGLRAYVNACPHQFLPLDYRGAQVLSADGTRLYCSNHQAGFLADNGQGIAGPGLGSALDPIPVIETARGMIVIAKAP